MSHYLQQSVDKLNHDLVFKKTCGPAPSSTGPMVMGYDMLLLIYLIHGCSGFVTRQHPFVARRWISHASDWSPMVFIGRGGQKNGGCSIGF